jgi:hypothetical protein
MAQKHILPRNIHKKTKSKNVYITELQNMCADICKEGTQGESEFFILIDINLLDEQGGAEFTEEDVLILDNIKRTYWRQWLLKLQIPEGSGITEGTCTVFKRPNGKEGPKFFIKINGESETVIKAILKKRETPINFEKLNTASIAKELRGKQLFKDGSIEVGSKVPSDWGIANEQISDDDDDLLNKIKEGIGDFKKINPEDEPAQIEKLDEVWDLLEATYPKFKDMPPVLEKIKRSIERNYQQIEDEVKDETEEAFNAFQNREIAGYFEGDKGKSKAISELRTIREFLTKWKESEETFKTCKVKPPENWSAALRNMQKAIQEEVLQYSSAEGTNTSGEKELHKYIKAFKAVDKEKEPEQIKALDEAWDYLYPDEKLRTGVRPQVAEKVKETIKDWYKEIEDEVVIETEVAYKKFQKEEDAGKFEGGEGDVKERVKELQALLDKWGKVLTAFKVNKAAHVVKSETAHADYTRKIAEEESQYSKTATAEVTTDSKIIAEAKTFRTTKKQKVTSASERQEQLATLKTEFETWTKTLTESPTGVQSKIRRKLQEVLKEEELVSKQLEKFEDYAKTNLYSSTVLENGIKAYTELKDFPGILAKAQQQADIIKTQEAKINEAITQILDKEEIQENLIFEGDFENYSKSLAKSIENLDELTQAVNELQELSTQ